MFQENDDNYIYYVLLVTGVCKQYNLFVSANKIKTIVHPFSPSLSIYLSSYYNDHYVCLHICTLFLPQCAGQSPQNCS